MLKIIKKIAGITRMLWTSFREYRGQIITMMFLGVLSGFFGGVGVSAIIPLFSIVANQSVPGANGIVRIIERIFEFVHVSMTLPTLLAFIVIFFALKGVVRFLARYLNERTSARLEERTRRDLFSKTLSSSWSFILEQKIGHLEQIIINDTNRMTQVVDNFNSVTLLVSNFLVYAFVAFAVSPVITISTVIFGIFFAFGTKPLLRRIQDLNGKISREQKEMAHYISEHTIGAKIVKTTQTGNWVLENAKGYLDKLKELKTKNAIYRNIPGSITEPIGFMFIAGLFIATYHSSSFNIASFAVVVYLIEKMFSFIQTAQSQLSSVNEMLPYMKGILKYRNLAIENQEKASGDLPFRYDKEIKFNRVSFAYHEKQEVLHDLVFNIQKGETIGIAGRSGSGKTTIADLLLRLFKPSRGEITIDSMSIDSISLRDWREHIAYVPQEVFLLNDTIENNIRFYNQNMNLEEIYAAAKDAQILETIQKLPEQFNTVVGERGLKLSGGQRQRIALARALARKPELLILDEATSALDYESEKLIQEAIESLKGKITVIIIAHRLSTIMKADKVIVLENGKVAESGDPKKLVNNDISYLAKSLD